MPALRNSIAKSALFERDWLEDCELFNDERSKYQFISSADNYRWRVRIKRSNAGVSNDICDGFFWTLDAAVKFRDGMLSGDLDLVDEAYANNKAARAHFKRAPENCFFFEDNQRYNLSMHKYDYIYIGEKFWRVRINKNSTLGPGHAISNKTYRLSTAVNIRDAFLLGDKRLLREAQQENEHYKSIYAARDNC